MASTKAHSKTAKSVKKGSKLASLKSVLFGSNTKKTDKTGKAVASSKKNIVASKTAASSTKKKVNPTSVAKTHSNPITNLKKDPPQVKTATVLSAKPTLKVKPKKAKSVSTRAGVGKSHLAAGETVCREIACEGLSTSGGYCRLHYIKHWKKIKRKELILKEKKLNQYIEELVAKYPDKYIEAIRQDLANDQDFAKVIHDLDLDEGVDDFEGEGEAVENIIDNIKRDFDDESEGF